VLAARCISPFLFLQHMISKMKSVEDGGSRLAIVFNGSSS